MKVLFYHNIPVNYWYEEWRAKRCPGHILYGFTELNKYGVEAFGYDIPFDPYRNRFRLMWYNLKQILILYRQFDLIYAVTHRGLELVIFLRALGIIRKPIVVWHHTAVVSSSNRIRNALSSFFYKGMDKLFFFSEPLLKRSLLTHKVTKEKVALIHWGADLKFYDMLRRERSTKDYFISTGRENRDFVTLIKAFNQIDQTCEIYTTEKIGDKDYRKILEEQLNESIADNVHLRFVNTGYSDLAEKVNNAMGVVICSFDLPYTVGLTTLVEALALGLPVITTANKNYPIDVECEGVGWAIPFGDVQSWVKAIRFLISHPAEAKEMGEKGRLLAEKLYNLDYFAREVAEELLMMGKRIVR